MGRTHTSRGWTRDSTFSSDLEGSHASTPITEPLSELDHLLSTADRLSRRIKGTHHELPSQETAKQELLSSFQKERLDAEPAISQLSQWLSQSIAEDPWTPFRLVGLGPVLDIHKQICTDGQIWRKIETKKLSVVTDDSEDLRERLPPKNKLRVFTSTPSSKYLVEHTALLDGGAEVCCISAGLAEALGCEIFPAIDENHPTIPRTINGDNLQFTGCTKINLRWITGRDEFYEARMRCFIMPRLQDIIQAHVLIGGVYADNHKMWEAAKSHLIIDPGRLNPRVAAPLVLDRRTKQQKINDQAALEKKKAAAILKDQQAEAEKRAEIQKLPQRTLKKSLPT